MIDNPEEFKSIIDTVRTIAVADSYDALIDLMNNSDVTIRQTGYDNWNGGINYYTVYFEVNINKFVEVRNDLNQWEQILLENFSLPVRHLYDEEISRVTIAPKSKLTPSPEVNPHRPLSATEIKRKAQLVEYLDQISEDELIEEVLLPQFRQLGFHRITAAGHKDKALEYGKDIWMKYILPTQHVLYFGIQVKKGKLDSSGVSKGSNANIAEIHNQALMMLGHEIFDPEIGKTVLVDHAFIVAGGEITKAAKNWLAIKLDASKRSQIIFMDREDILNLFIVNNLPLPKNAVVEEKPSADDLPF
jgi:hypothetical protein